MTKTPKEKVAKPLPVEDLEHVLNHTREHWEYLRGGKIFITGATGFFGIWLLETFCYANKKLNLGAELVGLTRNPAAFRIKVPHVVEDLAIKLHQGDVQNFCFPKGKFTHCIHAATTSSSYIPPRIMLDTIIGGTTRTIDFAVAAGIKRFLFVSSGAIYGKQPTGMTHIKEEHAGGPDTLHPDSAYAEGKRVGELLCAIARQNSKIEIMIARCFAFVGPHLPLDSHFAIGNFIRDVISKKPIIIKGDGTPCRSYLYAADLSIWLWTILLKGQSGSAYNVGSPDSADINQIAVKVSQTLEGEIRRKLSGNKKSRVVNKYIPNVKRAEAKLGLKQQISLEQSIKKTAAYYQNYDHQYTTIRSKNDPYRDPYKG